MEEVAASQGFDPRDVGTVVEAAVIVADALVDGLEALLAEVVRLRIVGFIIIGIIVATRKREAEDTAPGVELAAEVEVGAQVIACTVRIDLGIADVQRILVDACVLFLEVRGTAGVVYGLQRPVF